MPSNDTDLNDLEKVKVRYHLGYLNVQESSTFVLGVPAAVPTLFMIEGAMNRLIPAAIPMVQMWIANCDAVICELFGRMNLANYEALEEVKVNPKRVQELGKHYRFAVQSLAAIFGCPPNPFDPREWAQGNSLSIPVLNY